MPKTLTPTASTASPAEGLATVQTGVDEPAHSVPAALGASISHALGDAQDLTRRGIERAKQASLAVRETAEIAGDRTVGYIKDKPVQSVLVAAAAGALIAGLIGWARRGRAR